NFSCSRWHSRTALQFVLLYSSRTSPHSIHILDAMRLRLPGAIKLSFQFVDLRHKHARHIVPSHNCQFPARVIDEHHMPCCIKIGKMVALRPRNLRWKVDYNIAFYRKRGDKWEYRISY